MKELMQQRQCEAMGTRFEVWLRGDDAAHLDAVAVAVCEEILRLEAVLSRFHPSSEISRLNRTAQAIPVRLDREVFTLLEGCEQARLLTDGYFDITAATGGNGIVLDAARCTVQFTHPATRIDLGAIGKGYALDCGREILLRFGVTSGFLQGGTSSGLAVGADAWPLAVRHPLQAEQIVAQMTLTNRAFSCSAVQHAEQAQSDVINPQTGEPLTGNDACLALAASATEAEIYSTALLTMGKEKAARYLKHNDLQAGWITDEFIWLKNV